MVTLNAIFTEIFGLIFSFSAFTNTNFFVIIFTFILFGLAMITFGFFISTLVRKSRTAVLIGIFLLVIGLLFESLVFAGAYVGYIWWDAGTSPAGWIILMFIPFFNFGKIFLDISSYTTGRLDTLTQTFIPGPGKLYLYIFFVLCLNFV